MNQGTTNSPLMSLTVSDSWMTPTVLSFRGERTYPSILHSPPLTKPTRKSSVKMAALKNVSTAHNAVTLKKDNKRKLPILLFDVMDTLVHDPFYHDVPAFFRMSLKELIECKHPTAWVEFEKGLIDESELARKFFKDGRYFDLEGLKNCMKSGYLYIEGVEDLLCALKKSGYEMHAFTNYPIWYMMIEDELKLSTYLSWTFCSCIFGKRKPEAGFYHEVVNYLKIDAASCIFVDDRMRNVEAAIEVGLKGILFKNADLLRKDLSNHGVVISEEEQKDYEDVTQCLD